MVCSSGEGFVEVTALAMAPKILRGRGSERVAMIPLPYPESAGTCQKLGGIPFVGVEEVDAQILPVAKQQRVEQ